jgi:hypothetical protein
MGRERDWFLDLARGMEVIDARAEGVRGPWGWHAVRGIA